MPSKEAIDRARKDEKEGKAPSTQAGEFVREEMHHIREGKHGARSTKQAIAIGLSNARRAGVKLPPPPEDAKEETKESAESAVRRRGKPVSRKRSRAALSALKEEGKSAASHASLARQAKAAARERTAEERSGAARKGARTKGAAGRKAAARKGASTRARKT